MTRVSLVILPDESIHDEANDTRKRGAKEIRQPGRTGWHLATSIVADPTLGIHRAGNDWDGARRATR